MALDVLARIRRRWWILLAVGLLSIPILGIVVGFMIHWKVASITHELAALEAPIRERGEPLSFGELEAYYPAVKDDENSALIYVEVFKLFEQYREQHPEFLKLVVWHNSMNPGDEYSEERSAEVAMYLAEASAIFGALERARQLPHARFPLDYEPGALGEKGVTALTMYLLACLTSIRSFDAGRSGSATVVTDAEWQLLHMAESLRYSPSSPAQIIRGHILGTALLALQENIHLIDRTQLIAFQQAFQAADDSDALLRGLVGCRCLQVEAMRLNERNALYIEEGLPPILTGLKPYWDNETIGLLRFWEPLLELQNLPWHERLPMIETFAARAASLTKLQRMAQVYAESDLSSVHALNTGATASASARMALAALAIERYRDDVGGEPDALSALVPKYMDAVPDDPYDGAPIRYGLTDSGYILYSVHIDLSDDGGVKAEKDQQNNWHGDWIFEVHR